MLALEPADVGWRLLFARRSPTSLKLTLRLLREARASGDGLSACLTREFRAMQRCATPPSDFFEGVRAALVDKDRKPRWSPASVSGVSDAMIDEYFVALGSRELEVVPLPGFAQV